MKTTKTLKNKILIKCLVAMLMLLTLCASVLAIGFKQSAKADNAITSQSIALNTHIMNSANPLYSINISYCYKYYSEYHSLYLFAEEDTDDGFDVKSGRLKVIYEVNCNDNGEDSDWNLIHIFVSGLFKRADGTTFNSEIDITREIHGYSGYHKADDNFSKVTDNLYAEGAKLGKNFIPGALYTFSFAPAWTAPSGSTMLSDTTNTTSTFNCGLVELPADPYKNGYDFIGWYYDIDLTQPYAGAPITADTDLYAKFIPITYSITYNLNSGTLTGQATTYNIETATFDLAEPTRTGYAFGGWYDNASFTGTAITSIAKGTTGNKVYYAKWTPVAYTIAYELNGGTHTGESTTYNIESADITLTTPTKTGYTFNGWYADVDFSGSAITKITKGTTGNKALYAKYTVNSYSITYNLNGGNLSGHTSTYTVESDTITLATPQREGYAFKGWFTNSDLTGTAVSSITKGSTENKTFYAKFEILKFTVRFWVDGVETISMEVEWGQSLAQLYLVDSATMQAVTFYVDDTMNVEYNGETIIFDDLNLFTNSALSVYAKLTYDVDGVELSSDLLDYGATLNDLRTPQKAGHEFVGWYYDKECTKAVTSADKLIENKTVYAKFFKIPDPIDDSTFWTKALAWIMQNILYICAGILVPVVLAIVNHKRKKG